MFIPAKIVISGDWMTAASLIARAKSEMRILDNEISMRNLKRSVRRVVPRPGCSIECVSVFGQRTIYIHAPSGGRKRREEFSEYLWKVFVHVDVMDFSEWADEENLDEVWEVYHGTYSSGDQNSPWWLSGDRLTRAMIRSSVSCGVVDIVNNKLLWSGAKPHTLLAEQTGSPPTGWEGMATTRDYPETFLPVYDALFPEAPYYGQYAPPQLNSNNWFVPSINARSNFTETTSYSAYNGPYYVAGWPPLLGWGEKIEVYQATAPWGFSYSFGEYERGFYSQLSYYDTISRTMNIVNYARFSIMVNGEPSDQLLPTESRYYHRNRPEPLPNAHSFFGKQQYYRSAANFGSLTHPSVGVYYDLPDEYWDITYDTEYSWGWLYLPGDWNITVEEFETYTSHRFYGLMRRYNGYVSTQAPYNATNMLPYLDDLNMWFQGWLSQSPNNNNAYEILQTIGNYLCDNYRDDAGNCWFLSSRGGAYVKKLSNLTNIDTGGEYYRYDDVNTVRTAMTFAIACGFNIPKIGNHGSDYINGAVVDLAKLAVLNAGGNVYDPTTMPTMIRDDDIGFFEARAGRKHIRFHEMPGSLYCSPLFNIRVYAYPVKRTTVMVEE